MSLTPDEVQQFAHAAQAFERAARTIEGIGKGPASNSATIAVNAGGVGVWVAVTCCAVMLAANLFLAALVMDHSRKIDDLGDYLNAIYQMAPHLKQQEQQ